MQTTIYFHERHTDAIESGQKDQTVRPRDWVLSPGEQITLAVVDAKSGGYHEMSALITARIRIEVTNGDIKLGGEYLSAVARDAFVKHDGFASQSEFFGFLDDVYGLPFEGFCYRWKLLDANGEVAA